MFTLRVVQTVLIFRLVYTNRVVRHDFFLFFSIVFLVFVFVVIVCVFFVLPQGDVEEEEDDSDGSAQAVKKALQEKAKSMMAKHGGGSSKRSGSSGKSKRRGSGESLECHLAALRCALKFLVDAAADFSRTPVVALDVL